MSYSEIESPTAPDRIDQREAAGCAARRNRRARCRTSAAAPAPKNCSAAGLTKRIVPAAVERRSPGSARRRQDHRRVGSAQSDARVPPLARCGRDAAGGLMTQPALRSQAAARRKDARSAARDARPTSHRRLVDRGAEFRRARQPFRIPADCLRAMRTPTARPVMAQHVVVMAQDDLVSARRAAGRDARRRWRSHSITCANEPRPAIAAAPDHQPVGARFLRAPDRRRRGW